MISIFDVTQQRMLYMPHFINNDKFNYYEEAP